MGSICGKAHSLPQNTHSQHSSQHTSGAMNISSVGSTGTKTHSTPLQTKERGVSTSVGRWTYLGKGRRRAHICRVIVIDIAVFKVSHCAFGDINATTLRAARTKLTSFGAMGHIHMGSIRRKAHRLPQNAHNKVSIPVDETSGKVQDASTHKEQCCHGSCSLQSWLLLRM